MESSLTLWELKPEPASPENLYEDSWLLEETNDAFKQQEVKGESKAEVYSKLLEDLDNLDQLEDFIKEEPFSNWLEEKVDLPIFEDIRIEPQRYSIPALPRFKHEDLKPISHHVVHPVQTQTVQQDTNTNLLLQEFETVYGHVEMNHGQLTPPQSPPLVLTQLTSLNYITQRGSFSIPQQQLYYQPPEVAPEVAPATPQPDVAHELAVVEELVRSRAENLVDDSWEPAPSSPSSSSSCSFSEYSSDPEWIPDTVQSTSSPSGSNDLVERSPRGRKRAGKPYQKIGTEDKKSRKKEQNKNAATRYRMKKKAEIEEILSEERVLMDAKGELANQASDLQREIKCLKGLMRDLFKAKGLIQ